jgi:peptidoglycan/LPS O-acetylase OafA/YrhL
MGMDRRRHRIAYLDGLRGVAIISVVLWHYTSGVYQKFLPYGSKFESIPVLDHGWVGVNLFFLISGYVILLTLERCADFGDFMRRRWLRLFPAMLLASLAIFGISRVLGGVMPHGRPDAVNLLPGLTFLIPPLWEAVLRIPVDELDGAFWTLYVEMGFYIIFGMLYFRFGWRLGLCILTAIWITVLTVARTPLADLPAAAASIEVAHWFGTAYFGWLVSGALFLKAHDAGSARLFAAALGTGLVSAFTSVLWQPDDLLSCLYLAGCVVAFASAQRSIALQRLLSYKPLLFVGAVSYPLYLLHTEIGIGLLAIAGPVVPEPAWAALPVLMLAFMIVAAWVVTRWLEPWLALRLKIHVLRLTRAADVPPAPET